MFFSAAAVFAALALVSASPLPKHGPSCHDEHILNHPIVAVTEGLPISGYYLGVGKSKVPVLTSTATGVADISSDGGIAIWTGCDKTWLNYKGDASGGTQSLTFGKKEKTRSWAGAPDHSPINNVDYHSDTFQVCEVDGEWVVKLVTPALSEDVSCQYTQLQIVSA